MCNRDFKYLESFFSLLGVNWGGKCRERHTGLNNNHPDREQHLLSGPVHWSLQSLLSSASHLVPAQLCDGDAMQEPTEEPQRFR